MHTSRIVVGVDGEPASVTALTFALGEAAVHGARVLAVTCWTPQGRGLQSGPGRPACDSYDRAADMLELIVAEVAGSDAGETVVREVTGDAPGPALVAASKNALMLVLGATTRGSLAQQSGRTVLAHCLRHAEVPVTVVPWAPEEFTESDIAAQLHVM